MNDNTELIAELKTWLDAKIADPPYSSADTWDIELLGKSIDALEATTEQLAAAQAVIAEAALSCACEVAMGAPVDALAAHDRQVAAKALEEAAYEWGEGTWQDVWAGDGVDDDVTAVQSTVRWLRARAAVYRSTVKGEGN